MLSFIKGTLVAKALESPKGPFFLVDVHNIGFEILSSQRSVQSSTPAGSEIQLFTTLMVREDAMFLVGFSTKEERDLFNILQSASGVGTKVALSLLSSLSVSEIAQAVVSNQHNLLTKAKGVGPKLAQKMTLELKDKMMNWRSSEISLATQLTPAHASLSSAQREAFNEAESVLLSLGYQTEEISQSFQALAATREADAATDNDSAEAILREALRWLAQSV